MLDRMRGPILFLIISVVGSSAFAQFDDGPTSRPGGRAIPKPPPPLLPTTQSIGRFPHVQVDVKNQQLRIECQMLGITAPLEFFCVMNGTNEHESALRTMALASNIHIGLLMLGLTPGAPVRYQEETRTWSPPHGPLLNISAEFMKDGKLIRCPAARLMRSVKTKQPMPGQQFIFAGSAIGPDSSYAADITGYTVSVVNFDLSLIDVPQLASSSDETLAWEIDHDFAPPTGTAMTMIIEPAIANPAATTAPAAAHAP